MKNTARLSKKDPSAIKDFHTRISKLLGTDLYKMLLFGSKAEGRAAAESDIDVLVLIQDPAASKRHQTGMKPLKLI